jgi:hypothetical protein
MKTKAEVLEAIQAGRESHCIDFRDYVRLTEFYPTKDWPTLGFQLKEGATRTEDLKEWTEANILQYLQSDVAFGFEKALNHRGISAGLMFETVKMWLWILNDPLANFPEEDYAMYGLPLFKAVAVKYGWNNPIGNDSGSEDKYEDENE